jgi:hypothetical protein
MSDRPVKITLAEMRSAGVRGLDLLFELQVQPLDRDQRGPMA